jgi:hypothetical protein
MMKTCLIVIGLILSLGLHADAGCDGGASPSKEILSLNSYLMVGNLTCELAHQSSYLAPYNWYRKHFRNSIAKHAAQVHHSLALCSSRGAESSYNSMQTNLGNQWALVAGRDGRFCLQAMVVLKELVDSPSEKKLEEIAKRLGGM